MGTASSKPAPVPTEAATALSSEEAKRNLRERFAEAFEEGRQRGFIESMAMTDMQREEDLLFAAAVGACALVTQHFAMRLWHIRRSGNGPASAAAVDEAVAKARAEQGNQLQVLGERADVAEREATDLRAYVAAQRADLEKAEAAVKESHKQLGLTKAELSRQRQVTDRTKKLLHAQTQATQKMQMYAVGAGVLVGVYTLREMSGLLHHFHH